MKTKFTIGEHLENYRGKGYLCPVKELTHDWQKLFLLLLCYRADYFWLQY